MKPSYIVLSIMIYTLLVVSATHYLYPRIETKTVDQEITKYNVVTVTRTVTKPDGTSDTTTTTTDRTISKATETKQQSTTAATLNVSGLVANDFSQGLLKPIYGVSVSKQLIGPITVGGFGLTNGTIGVSIGLNF